MDLKKNTIIFAILVIFTFGCAHTSLVKATCLDVAIDSASTWNRQTGWKIRLLYWQLKDGRFHIAAQTFDPVKKEWVWIKRKPWRTMYDTEVNKTNVHPDKIFSLEEARKKWRHKIK